jgi:hypothetical protein
MIVKKAEYIKDYKIKLHFSDGVSKIVDFKPFLTSTRKIITPLIDTDYFKSFYVDEITICWPNGLDFAPELLHDIGVDVQAEKKQIKPRGRVLRKSTIEITHRPIYAFEKKRSKKVKS